MLIGLPAVVNEDDAFHDGLRRAIDIHFDPAVRAAEPDRAAVERGPGRRLGRVGVYLHPCGVTAQERRQRIWRAQIRCLMPVIDEERSRLEAWVRSEVRDLPADQVLEPSHLFDLMLSAPRLSGWRGGHRKRLIYWLRDARNTLAHMGTLSPDDIARGKRLIWEDRKHG